MHGKLYWNKKAHNYMLNECLIVLAWRISSLETSKTQVHYLRLLQGYSAETTQICFYQISYLWDWSHLVNVKWPFHLQRVWLYLYEIQFCSIASYLSCVLTEIFDETSFAKRSIRPSSHPENSQRYRGIRDSIVYKRQF